MKWILFNAALWAIVYWYGIRIGRGEMRLQMFSSAMRPRSLVLFWLEELARPNLALSLWIIIGSFICADGGCK